MERSFEKLIGYDRFEGERASQQLGDVYQALRLYINGFQPSMKLLAKQYDGKKMRRIYDPAKTPLQRLLLSHVLSPFQEQELQRVSQVLDPLRLFHYLQDLQQALLHFRTSVSSRVEGVSAETMLPFCIERCLGKAGHSSSKTEEGVQQKHVLSPCAPDPVASCQPEQATHERVHALHREVSPSLVLSSQQPGEAGLLPPHPIVGVKEAHSSARTTNDGAVQDRRTLRYEPVEGSHVSLSHRPSHASSSDRTLEQTIQEFLEDQKRQHRRPKTLEWHTHALGLFERYLLTEHQCLLLEHITEMQVRGWFVALSQQPTVNGTLRSPNTVESYARSARAFCQWGVDHHSLSATPFAHLLLPPVENGSPLPLEPEEWEQLLLACYPPKETGAGANLAAARNRAILWVLFDTGMHSTEICRLCLGDVDREQGTLRVQGKGTAARWLTLGPEGQRHLLAYLDQYRLKMARSVKPERANSEPLFLTETGRPLTKGTIGLLFGRLSERVAIPGKTIGVSLVRKNFMARYMQIGGDHRRSWNC